LPNPNTGIFTVELLIPAYVGKEMRIVDITGRVLLVKQLDIGSQSQRVDVGVLPQGLYLLQIVSEGRVLAVEKFAKQ
jgi:hypothetical protein